MCVFLFFLDEQTEQSVIIFIPTGFSIIRKIALNLIKLDKTYSNFPYISCLGQILKRGGQPCSHYYR
jgi:hypothetical protein